MNESVNIKKIIISLILMLAIITLAGCFFVKRNNEDDSDKTTSSSPSTSESTQENTSDSTSTTTSMTSSETTTTSATTTTTSTTTKTTTTTTKKITDKVTYINGILVANKSYSLPKSYAPGVNSTAKSAFDKLAADAKSEGVELWIRSGYRSYDYQANLYNNYVKRDGKKAADTYSARPGHSEHQTGLAFDINSLSTSFGETKEGKWLAENCWKYGFIIRYPKGKEAITGYQYEPWHIRYIGKEHAKAVYDSGLTLEEYLGIDSKYSD